MASNVSAMEEGVVVDAAKPEASNLKAPSNRRKLLFMWSVFGVLAVLALAFGLGFGLDYDNDDATSPSKIDRFPDTTPTNDPPAPTGPVNDTPEPGDNNTTPFIPSLAVPSTTRLAAISPESVSQTYASCADLASDLKLSTRLAAQHYMEQSAMWYFLPQTWPVDDDEGDGGKRTDNATSPAPAPTMADDVAASEPGLGGRGPESGKGESSYGTNNQVEGVEEADIVQSNGIQVFAAYGSEILELKADTSTLTRRIQVPPSSSSGGCKEPINTMLLVGQRLIVIVSKYSYCAYGSISKGDGSTMATTKTVPPEARPIISTSEATRVLIYDTKDMSLLSDEAIRGYYTSARAIEDNVHIVTNTYFDTWRLLQYLDPYMIETEAGFRLNKTEYLRRAEAELDTRLDDYVNKLASELDCLGTQKIALLQNTDDDLSFTNNIESLVSITSFAATSPAVNSTKNMLIPSGGLQVYSSAERLVLAIQGWWMADGATQQTYLVTYKYDEASTHGSTLGSVPGYVLNQFSIDHMALNEVDYLRVATSTQSVWALNEETGIWEPATQSTSQVSILQFNDGQAGSMPMVGQISNLGKPGEQIFSVRFIGDKGFVVTFEQTDPFYTLDLSDPTNPTVAGELEIPGYSSYLHPISDDQIIGVGQAADANGTITGLQISLFDVSDFENPVRVQNFVVSSRNSSMSGLSSEAEYDHKALRYLPTSKLLIIPVTYYEYTEVPCDYSTMYPRPMEDAAVDAKQETVEDDLAVPNSTEVIDMPWRPWICYNNTGGFDGFRVYKIDETAGISQHVAIEHASGNDFAYGCWSSAFLQARSLVFDGELMTLKGHSILSNDLSTLEPIAAPIILDTKEEECHPWMY